MVLPNIIVTDLNSLMTYYSLISLIFVTKKSNAISYPMLFVATATNALAPSCLRMPDVDEIVMFKYLN